MTRARRIGTSLATVFLCLYLPFSWLLVIDYPWNGYRLFWIKLWPILPGFIPGFLLFHPHDTIEYTTMGIVSVMLLSGLTWLGSLGRWRLMTAAILAILASSISALLAYGIFRA